MWMTVFEVGLGKEDAHWIVAVVRGASGRCSLGHLSLIRPRLGGALSISKEILLCY